jgi:hypothetical protein
MGPLQRSLPGVRALVLSSANNKGGGHKRLTGAVHVAVTHVLGSCWAAAYALGLCMHVATWFHVQLGYV